MTVETRLVLHLQSSNHVLCLPLVWFYPLWTNVDSLSVCGLSGDLCGYSVHGCQTVDKQLYLELSVSCTISWRILSKTWPEHNVEQKLRCLWMLNKNSYSIFTNFIILCVLSKMHISCLFFTVLLHRFRLKIKHAIDW